MRHVVCITAVIRSLGGTIAAVSVEIEAARRVLPFPGGTFCLDCKRNGPYILNIVQWLRIATERSFYFSPCRVDINSILMRVLNRPIHGFFDQLLVRELCLKCRNQLHAKR
jgi:hypothetical protein